MICGILDKHTVRFLQGYFFGGHEVIICYLIDRDFRVFFSIWVGFLVLWFLGWSWHSLFILLGLGGGQFFFDNRSDTT